MTKTRPGVIEHDLRDRLILAVDRWLGARAVPRTPAAGAPRGPSTGDGAAPGGSVAYPAEGFEDGPLDARARRRSGRLMRVNHAGEVAAQALYLGQGMLAGEPRVRRALDAAASEERAHLDWCRRRLAELGTRPSRLDPVWWAGSFVIGTAAGAAGDASSLGFVAETERQVAEHLARHLRRLPPGDHRSRAICRRMLDDERRHGTRALEAGGRRMPAPVRLMMRLAAGVMTSAAYRL